MITTIKTSQSPASPTTAKTPASVNDDKPIATAPEARQRDRVELTPKASEAGATATESDLVAKARTAQSQAALKTEGANPEAAGAQTSKPESSPPATTPPKTARASTPAGRTTTARTTTTRSTASGTTARQPQTGGAATTRTTTTRVETTRVETTTQVERTVVPEIPPQKKLLLNHRPFQASVNPLTEQKETVDRALAGQEVAFANTTGGSALLSIKRKGTSRDGTESFQLQVAGSTINVTVAQGLVARDLLARFLDFYTRTPGHLRGELERVELEVQHYPQDAYWAKVYGKESFSSAATAGGGLISFWNLKDNPHNLSEGTFSHEMGHLIGEYYTSSREQFSTRIPHGWADAAKADNDRVSGYAAMNPDEDFAESWSYFTYAQTDPQMYANLRERIPHRLQILEAIDENRLDRRSGRIAPRRPLPTGSEAR